MKKLFATLLVVVMVAALFAGCANNTVDPAAAPQQANAPTILDTPATDAPATDAPATAAPATDAPATDAPATDAPAVSTGVDGVYYATEMNGQSLLDYYDGIAREKGMALADFLTVMGMTESDLLSLMRMDLYGGTATMYQMGEAAGSFGYTFDGTNIIFADGTSVPYVNNGFTIDSDGTAVTFTRQP